MHLSLCLLALTTSTVLAASSSGAGAAASSAPKTATAAVAGTTATSVPTSERTNEAQEAAIKNPQAECTAYYYEPVADVMPTFPDIWSTANLSFAGVTAHDKALFQSMESGIPNVAPRGTRAGDFSGVTYDITKDPDCWWTDTRCTTPKLAGLQPDITRCPEPNTWGFTLDDGPNCSHNAYFDYLLGINQKATLFYIGSNVLDWPLEAQRGLTDGHEICSHTWSHPYMTSMTNEQAFAELYFSKKAIKDVLGITVRCVRMPYGDVDDRIRYIASKLDLRIIQWETDTFDYNWNVDGIASVQKNYDTILAQQANGTYNAYGPIVLSHEIDGETMAISQSYLPKMRKAFTGGVVPVGVCLNNTQPYVEGAQFVYPNYAVSIRFSFEFPLGGHTSMTIHQLPPIRPLQQYVAGTVSVSLAAPTAVTVDVQLALSPAATSAGSSTASAAGAASSGGIRTVSGASSMSTSRAGSSTTSSSNPSPTSSSSTKSAASRTLSFGSVELSLSIALGSIVALFGMLLVL